LTLVQPPGLQAGGGYAAAATQPAWEEPPPDLTFQDDPAAISEQETAIERIKTALEQRKRMILVIALDGASRALIEGDELCIEFAPESKHLRENLSKPESVKLLREICREVTGRDTGIRISVKERGENSGQPLSKQEAERAEKQRLREIAEQHPLVQKALRTLRGEIVDVRKIEDQ
jgi:response regulator RpfG family c-di-GMP phosphodiesterase